MSFAKFLTLLTIIACALGIYVFINSRTESSLLSEYVHTRYAAAFDEAGIKGIIVIPGEGDSEIEIIDSEFSRLIFWFRIQFTKGHSYQVNSQHKNALLGVSIMQRNGRYYVLIPRDGVSLNAQQWKGYIDSIAKSQL